VCDQQDVVCQGLLRCEVAQVLRVLCQHNHNLRFSGNVGVPSVTASFRMCVVK
jgi:hypothetical protein